MSRLSNWVDIKRRELAKINNAVDANYLLLSVTPHEGLNSNITLLMSVESVLNELLQKVIKIMKKRSRQANRELVDIFVTVDQIGRISPGNRQSKLGTLNLVDGQILFLTYILAKHGGHTRWKPTILPDAMEAEKICYHCGKTEDEIPAMTELPTKFINCNIGFRAGKLCIYCFRDSLKLDGDEPLESQLKQDLITYTCNDCGARGAGLTGDNELMSLITKCPGHCLEQPKNPVCQCCSIPVDSSMKCGACKAVYYCSKECQIKNWAIHKEICQH